MGREYLAQTPMIWHVIFALALAGMTVFNYCRGRRNVLYPPFLFSVIWLVVFSLYLLLYIVPVLEINHLRAYTLFVVFLGVLAFSLGGMLPGRHRYVAPASDGSRKGVKLRKLLFFFSLALLPLFIMEVRRLSAAGGLDGFLASARVGLVDELTEGQSSFGGGLNSIAPLFAIFVAFISLLEAKDLRKQRIWIWTPIAVALVFCILTTGRAGFLKLLAGLAAIYVFKTGQYSAKQGWRFIRWPLLAFVFLFIVLVPMTKNLSSDSEDVGRTIAQLSVGYAVVPLAGFDYILHHPNEVEYDSNHTFREFLPILARLAGLDYQPVARGADFLMVPFFTNVYTAFEPYYADFGFAGMLIVMFLIGAGQTCLFWQAAKGSSLYIFLFAISLYPLSMVAFDDTYTLFTHYLLEIAFAVLYFGVIKRVPRLPNPLSNPHTIEGAYNS